MAVGDFMFNFFKKKNVLSDTDLFQNRRITNLELSVKTQTEVIANLRRFVIEHLPAEPTVPKSPARVRTHQKPSKRLQDSTGYKLWVTRKAKGLSQSELGEKLNLKHSTISDMENNKRAITKTEREVIEQVLGKTF